MSENFDRFHGIVTVCIGAGLIGLPGSIGFGFLTMWCHLFELSGVDVPDGLLTGLARLTIGSITVLFGAIFTAIFAAVHYAE